jgi:hypothetical protein
VVVIFEFRVGEQHGDSCEPGHEGMSATGVPCVPVDLETSYRSLAWSTAFTMGLESSYKSIASGTGDCPGGLVQCVGGPCDVESSHRAIT